jgi:hypothetical protein
MSPERFVTYVSERRTSFGTAWHTRGSGLAETLERTLGCLLNGVSPKDGGTEARSS